MPWTRWCVVVGAALAGLTCSQAVGQAPWRGGGYAPAVPNAGSSGPRATPENPFAPTAVQPTPWFPGAAAEGPLPLPRGPVEVTQKQEGELGQLTGKVVLQQGPGADDPQAKRAWQADQAWRLPLSGPFFVFGQMAGASDEAAQKDMKLNGRTGLACKLPVGPAEFVVRGGPGVRYTDPLRPLLTREQADWQLGVEARCPLVFGLGLEYQGTATPALTPLERDQVRQDVHLAIPVGEAGKFQVGARHQWENAGQPRPLSEGMEVYVGLRLQR